MVLAIIAFILASVAVIVFFSYKKSLDQSLKNLAVTQNSLIRDEVELWFAPFFSDVEKVVGAAKHLDDSKKILPLLSEIKQSRPDMTSIYWTGEVPYTNGGFFVDVTGWIPPSDYDQTTRSWFIKAKSSNRSIVTDPYVDMMTNKVVVSVAEQFNTFDGAPAGVVGIDIFITKVGELVQAQKLSKKGSSFMLTKDGLFVTHPDETAVLKKSPFDEKMMAGLREEILGSESSFGYFSGNQYYYSSVRMKSTDWIFITFGPLSDIYSPLWIFAALLSVVSFAAVLIAIVLTFMVARSMTVPLAAACSHTEKIATGNLADDFDRNLVRRKDEFGDLARSLQNMIERLRSVIQDIDEASLQVSSGSQQMSSTSQQISQGATEQAASVEQISAAMEQMSSNIKQNADNALQTEKIAQKSVQAVELGGSAVAATVTAMKEIASKINIIEEIARSTNMLSLNASIEAARAGEFGKGFAVVASEVGKLAERSQKEAGEISSLSRESVTIAEQAGTTIAAVIPDIKRTAELVQEISAASNEQTTGTEQINQAIMQLDKVVQQNASSAEESASMSEELAGQSQQMRENISYFRIHNTNSAETAGAGIAAPVARIPKDSGLLPVRNAPAAIRNNESRMQKRTDEQKTPSQEKTRVRALENNQIRRPSAAKPVAAANAAQAAQSKKAFVLEKKPESRGTPQKSDAQVPEALKTEPIRSVPKEQQKVAGSAPAEKNLKREASKTSSSVLGRTSGVGIHLVLDDDSPGLCRDSLDNEYQEF